jgi:CAAX protease family protein
MNIEKYRRPVLFYTLSTAGCFNEAFNTHPDSKVIQTGLLLVLAIFLVANDTPFFLSRDYREG